MYKAEEIKVRRRRASLTPPTTSSCRPKAKLTSRPANLKQAGEKIKDASKD
jgi:hypothetical protein